MNRRLLGVEQLRQHEERGPNGRRLCRYAPCNNEVPPGRRTWCSEECVHQYRLLAHWNYARQHLRKREKGVCQVCGTDTRKLKSSLMNLWKAAAQIGRGHRLHKNLYRFAEYKGLAGQYAELAERLSRCGFHGFASELPKSWRPRKAWKKPSDMWEADHILPVVEGGTHAPGNLRTLCQPCHKQMTRALATKRKKLNVVEG
ncbi:HNH endonuclease signature motif containing protein [uncultured Meiothermus sp.]|jgi:5-methylcytosine-specific restriction endonuclease McrA|uniref:HNH endonuclease n=1 Tax=uncultured Meiothermus sp. TaxID=157471 RepID=UPI0026096246|nr:HNH endonuclease signature motif containing protein [uncultured Meiothermus sp.]